LRTAGSNASSGNQLRGWEKLWLRPNPIIDYEGWLHCPNAGNRANALPAKSDEDAIAVFSEFQLARKSRDDSFYLGEQSL
jgi:hypothetical protein